MRFFFGCIRCCCTKSLPADDDESPSPSPKGEEETCLLIPSGLRFRQRRRRRRGARLYDWKPSLFSIAEDTSIRVAPRDNLVMARASSSFKFRRRLLALDKPRTIEDLDIGRDHHSKGIPISTPAPFMMF